MPRLPRRRPSRTGPPRRTRADRPRLSQRGGAVAGALLAVTATVAPASAGGPPPVEVGERPVAESAPPDEAGAAPHGELRLTLTGAEETLSWTRAVDLDCPDGAGRHPEAGLACAELDAVDGELPRLPGGTEPCTREYAPVTATADGVWRGQEVSWRGSFATLCELRRATGAVFLF